METLCQSFHTFGFKGDFSIGLIDYKHISIRFVLEEDFLRCWMKSARFVEGYHMRAFKWHPLFSVEVKPFILPIWITFEGLPACFLNKHSVFSLGQVVGTPLKINLAIATLLRPSLAKVCVEVDLLQKFPAGVRLGIEEGKWQKINYEHIPLYCTKYHKQGHKQAKCLEGNQIVNSNDNVHI
ncbi:hypothetical protein ACH5RR_025901 [Cinchona calisaya]|uniref:DUF4283 domain-containing protein n=1 Tax=Cinchona calisaya TaxID=153742 RepID=A0ABD2Z220_9GENT